MAGVALCWVSPNPKAVPWDTATLPPACVEPEPHLTSHRLAVESRVWALR